MLYHRWGEDILERWVLIIILYVLKVNMSLSFWVDARGRLELEV